jgi:hypothetical protein
MMSWKYWKLPAIRLAAFAFIAASNILLLGAMYYLREVLAAQTCLEVTIKPCLTVSVKSYLYCPVKPLYIVAMVRQQQSGKKKWRTHI